MEDVKPMLNPVVLKRLMLSVLTGSLLPVLARPARAQTERTGPGQAPFSHMHMILERTILKVDVLALDVCVDAMTAASIAPHARSAPKGADADSVARAVIAADRAVGDIRFLRNVSLGQFLGGIRDEQKKAVSAGLLSDSTFRMIGDSLPVWFSFLEERGIRKSDRITYVFHGNSLRTIYRDPDGSVLLDQTDVGEQRRTSVLATWFAPGSAFRGRLLESLADGPPAPAVPCSQPVPAS